MNRELLKKTLNANLDSLKSRSRTLGGYLSQLSAEDYWDRLIPAKASGYTIKIESGGSVKSVNSGYDPFKEAQKHLDKDLKARVSSDLSFVHYFGAGLGYHLKLMTESLGDRAKIVLYEKEPDWLILTFSIHDFRKEIDSGGLTIFLDGISDPPPPPEVSRSPNDLLWAHPVLWVVYEKFYNKLMKSIILSDPAPKLSVLNIIIYPYSAYLNLANAVSQSLKDIGYSVSRLACNSADIRQSIFADRPDMLFSLSFSATIARFADDMKIPYVCWELDKIMNEAYVPHTLSPYTHVFTTFSDDTGRFEKAGANACYLPAAPDMLLDDNYESPDEEFKSYSCDVSFIGSPLIATNNDYLNLIDAIQRAMASGEAELLKAGRSLIGALSRAIKQQEKFSDINVYKLPELLDKELKACAPLSLFSFSKHSLCNIIAKQCCGYQRLSYLEKLSPVNVSVYGNEDWSDVKQSHLLYKGKAEFDREAAKIFRASKINLDITRIYALDGFSDRVFNVLRAGGFLMMNRTKNIGQSFNAGKELEVFDTPDEMKQMAEYYLTHETERLDIAERGKARVREEHTVTNRVKFMLSKVEGLRKAAAQV